MKKFIFLATVVLLFGFADSEKVVFKSIDGKTKITASEYWTAAGNMKGVEIYISKENQKNKSSETIVVSKDENIPETMDLSTYSASKLFLQTAPLKSTPSFSGLLYILGNVSPSTGSFRRDHSGGSVVMTPSRSCASGRWNPIAMMRAMAC